MSLAAGTLNRLVTIQRRQDGEDEAGQPLTGWEDVAQVRANIKGPTGLGSITGLQDNVAASINRYSFRIRYRTGIDAGMRVLHDGLPFDIRQVLMDFERRNYTDLVCEQGGSEG